MCLAIMILEHISVNVHELFAGWLPSVPPGSALIKDRNRAAASTDKCMNGQILSTRIGNKPQKFGLNQRVSIGSFLHQSYLFPVCLFGLQPSGWRAKPYSPDLFSGPRLTASTSVHLPELSLSTGFQPLVCTSLLSSLTFSCIITLSQTLSMISLQILRKYFSCTFY